MQKSSDQVDLKTRIGFRYIPCYKVTVQKYSHGSLLLTLPRINRKIQLNWESSADKAQTYLAIHFTPNTAVSRQNVHRESIINDYFPEHHKNNRPNANDHNIFGKRGKVKNMKDKSISQQAHVLKEAVP